ncbi:MAG: thioredoxin family protein [Deltaproteobacteria bacterium]|nr:thioredoxin family protein [Deltaproteobacteria bacterium]
MKFSRHYAIRAVCLVMGFLLVWPSLPTQAQSSPAAKGKPALYEFGSKYCIPCKEMKEVMAALKTSHGDQVEFRLVYVDEEKPLFGQYKIVAIPTQVFLDASGKEVDRHLGALPKEEVIRKLKELKFIAN